MNMKLEIKHTSYSGNRFASMKSLHAGSTFTSYSPGKGKFKKRNGACAEVSPGGREGERVNIEQN